MPGTAHNPPTTSAAATTDNSPIPSWVQILDSPPFTGRDVNGGSTTEAMDDGLLRELQEPTSWHHSPMLQVPVTGYHNRLTGSGLTPDLTQPAAGLGPSLVSLGRQSLGPQSLGTEPHPSLASLSLRSVEPHNLGTGSCQDWPAESQVTSRGGEDTGGLPTAGRWHSILHLASLLTGGDDPGKRYDRSAADYCAAAPCPQNNTADRISGPMTLLCPSAGWPASADHGVYSELVSHSPQGVDRPSGHDGPGHPEKTDLGDRYHNVSGSHDSHLNDDYSASLDGSVGALSADRPDVHKPEEYLAALQATDSYSVQYAHAPCGRCTRVVTSLLVVLSLAVVSLAAALTASVITRADAGEKVASLQGQPVVRAIMTLKILNKNFTSAMSQVESDAFYNIANPYSTELDRLFLKSPLAKVYRGNKVISLSPGSIKTSAELLFLDTGLIRDPMAVKNVITSADPASNWAQSDAREVGQFVVCADCVTVHLEQTKIGLLPLSPVLTDGGILTSTVPRLTTRTTVEAMDAVTTLNPASAIPKVTVSSTHPFITDGHYVITCDVIDAGEWSEMRLEFKSDSKTQQKPVVLVTLLKTSPDQPQVAKQASSRVFAYSAVFARSVGLVVNVTAITCADRGSYVCQVTLKDQRRYDSSGRVNILELPSLPEISEIASPEFVLAAESVYVCSVNLGYPIGELVFKAQSRNGTTSRLAYSWVSKDSCSGLVKATVRESSLPRDTVRLTCEVLTPHADLMAPGYPLTHFTLPKYVKIQTKSTTLDDGLAVVRCRVTNNVPWSRLSVLKDSPAGGSSPLVALTPDGSTGWKDLNLRQRSLVTSDVTTMTSELSVFIHSLKCTDDGVYKCAVQVGDILTEVQQNLTVIAKPSIPELTLPVHVTERTSGPITLECMAKVGHPAGSLVLAVKSQNEAEPRAVMLNELALTPLTCDRAVTGRYHTTGGQLGNGTTVTCSVLPPPTVLPPFLNATRTTGLFTYLPDSLCLGAGQDANVTHPRDCRYIIHCDNDVIAEVRMCPDGVCFSALTNQCSEPVPLPTHVLTEDKRCGSGSEAATWPDVHQCTSYMQCLNGLPVTQHCARGEIYVSGTQCSSDVTKSHCYKTLDWNFGVGTALTQL